METRIEKVLAQQEKINKKVSYCSFAEMMEKMIDIKEYLKQTKTVLVTQDAFDELKQRAFARTKIIRCKDCKHYYEGNRCEIHEYLHFKENDFCSYAERQEE